MSRELITRDSDGATIDLAKEEAEQADTTNKAKKTVSAPMATRLDEASETVTYIGTATIGTAASAASWRIKRLTISGTELITEWADSNEEFDNIWDNRTELSYG